MVGHHGRAKTKNRTATTKCGLNQDKFTLAGQLSTEYASSQNMTPSGRSYLFDWSCSGCGNKTSSHWRQALRLMNMRMSSSLASLCRQASSKRLIAKCSEDGADGGLLAILKGWKEGTERTIEFAACCRLVRQKIVGSATVRIEDRDETRPSNWERYGRVGETVVVHQ